MREQLNNIIYPITKSFGQQQITHTPTSYKNITQPLYGSPNFLEQKNNHAQMKNLAPAPRSQLGNPTEKLYSDEYPLSKYYENSISNANWVRGNQFASAYPYKISEPIVEKIKRSKNTNTVMRANSPFYPFPSFLNKNKNAYRTYPHAQEYLQQQPIYNYPYNQDEGITEGPYTFQPIPTYDKILETFSNKNYLETDNIYSITFISLILVFLGYFIFSNK